MIRLKATSKQLEELVKIRQQLKEDKLLTPYQWWLMRIFGLKTQLGIKFFINSHYGSEQK